MDNNSQSNAYYENIGLVIKELRKKKGLTKTQLAEGICSISHISRIESGERCPSSIILRQITYKLGISPNFLFRAIESPYALDILELLDELFFYMDRDDFSHVYSIVKSKKILLNVKMLGKLSIHDKQIIMGLFCMSEAFLEKKYSWGIEELNKHLMMTYSEGCNPTDIEFGFMFHMGYFLVLNNQKEEGYKYLKNLEKYIADIKYYHTHAIYVKYYLYLATACLDTGRYEESQMYLETAMDYCKKNNIHYLLRDLFYIQSELYFYLNDEEKHREWLNKSISLNNMIKYSDTEYFETFYKERLSRLKKN